MKPVAGKRKRRFGREGSKYDPILDRFIEGKHDLVKVEVENRDASYMRWKMVRLIRARDLEDRVKASVVNGVMYRENVYHHNLVLERHGRMYPMTFPCFPVKVRTLGLSPGYTCTRPVFIQ